MEEESEHTEETAEAVPVLSAFISRFRNAAPAPPSEREHLSGDRMWWLSTKDEIQYTERTAIVPSIGFLEKSVDFGNDIQSTISSIKVRQSDKSLDLTSIRSSVDGPSEDEDADDSVLRHADELYKRLCNNLKELQSGNPLKESLQLPVLSSIDSDVSEIVKSAVEDLRDLPPVDSLEFDHLRLRNALTAFATAAAAASGGDAEDEDEDDCDNPIVRDSLDVKPALTPLPDTVSDMSAPTEADELQVPLTSIVNATQLSVTQPQVSFDEIPHSEPNMPAPPPIHPHSHIQPVEPMTHADAASSETIETTTSAVVPDVDLNASVDSTLFMYMSSDDEEEPAPRQTSTRLPPPPPPPAPVAQESKPLSEDIDDWTVVDRSDVPTAVECDLKTAVASTVTVETRTTPRKEVVVTEETVLPLLDQDEELKFLWERLCAVREAIHHRKQQNMFGQ